MKASLFSPARSYLTVEVCEEENSTQGGIITTENTEDFLLIGEIVCSNSDRYKQGKVVFSRLDAESFRDTSKTYFLIKDSSVKGVYGE